MKVSDLFLRCLRVSDCAQDIGELEADFGFRSAEGNRDAGGIREQSN